VIYWCISSAINNPNTSDEAKWEAEKKLHELEGPQGKTDNDSKDPTHVAAGLKAYVEIVEQQICIRRDILIRCLFRSAISNPNTSNEAKAEAEKKLYDLEHGPQGKNLGNVAGGLKA
jgi:hypothetical protein